MGSETPHFLKLVRNLFGVHNSRSFADLIAVKRGKSEEKFIDIRNVAVERVYGPSKDDVSCLHAHEKIGKNDRNGHEAAADGNQEPLHLANLTAPYKETERPQNLFDKGAQHQFFYSQDDNRSDIADSVKDLLGTFVFRSVEFPVLAHEKFIEADDHRQREHDKKENDVGRVEVEVHERDIRAQHPND